MKGCLGSTAGINVSGVRSEVKKEAEGIYGRTYPDTSSQGTVQDMCEKMLGRNWSTPLSHGALEF